MTNSVLEKTTGKASVRLLVSCAGLLASGALCGATYTSFLNTATDISLPGSWQG